MPDDRSGSGVSRPIHCLAFDFGLRHIGVAAGNTRARVATPVDTVRARDGIPDPDHIDRLLATWQPDEIVVGLPLNMDGSESPLCPRARKFGRRLAHRAKARLIMIDERLSSREAAANHAERIAAAGRRMQAPAIDGAGSAHAEAAAVILESRFDADD